MRPIAASLICLAAGGLISIRHTASARFWFLRLDECCQKMTPMVPKETRAPPSTKETRAPPKEPQAPPSMKEGTRAPHFLHIWCNANNRLFVFTLHEQNYIYVQNINYSDDRVYYRTYTLQLYRRRNVYIQICAASIIITLY